MTRLSIVERAGLVAVGLFVLVLGFQVGHGDGWWRWPASVVLVLAGAAVLVGVLVASVRQGGDGGDDDA